jgi:alanyl-tRNA synthetase
VEESGIAKGIRRIIAYTGDAAHEVQRLALEFGKRLEAVEKMPHGPEKEAEVRATQQDLNQLTISALTKEELRIRFAKVQKDVLDEQKKKQKVESKTALDTVIGHFDHPDNKDSKVYIGQLPISANPRAIADVMNHFKTKAKDKTVYLFGGSESEGAVVHGVYVGTVSIPLGLWRQN